MERIRNIKHSSALALLLATTSIVGTTSCSNAKQEGHEVLVEANPTRNDPIWDSAHVNPKEELGEGINIIRDAGIAFYMVKKGDSLREIWEKLKETEDFSYLKNPDYQPTKTGRNIKSFNTPANSLKAGFLVPIPMEIEKRITSLHEFKEWSLKAIDELLQHESY